MANYKLMIPWIKRWEGGWSNDKDDSGGCTMAGVTIKTFQQYYGKDQTCEDLKHITEQQWEHIFKTGYWDKMKADDINSQQVAELVVQMAWGSGPVTTTKRIQKLLGVKQDGVIGEITLWHINKQDPRELFEKLWNMRFDWLWEIGDTGKNKKFLKGWIKRLCSMRYEK